MKRTLSIETRLIAAFCLVAVATACACMGAYYRLIDKDFSDRTNKELATAHQIQNMASREQQNRALLIASNLSALSSIRDGIRNKSARELDDILWSRSLGLDADFLAVIDLDGVVVSQVEPSPAARNSRKIHHGSPLFLDALFQRALDGRQMSGFESCSPGVICMNAYSEVYYRKNIIGYVRVGIAIDDHFARWIKDITGTDFILVRENATAVSSLAGKAISSKESEALVAAMDNPAHGARSPKVQGPVAMNFNLRGKPYILQGRAIADAGGKELGRLFVGRDAAELFNARKRALRALALITIPVLLFAVAIGYALSVRQAKPLKILLRRVREITRGELKGEIPVAGADEIRTLAAAFNEMSSTLADRDALLRQNASELLNNQEQIIQSGKLAAIGELAAGVAHEIGNPLSAISGYAQMIKKGSLPPETQTEYAAEIERESGFIENIIQDLLDFARPSSEGPVVLDLNDIADSALKTVSAHKSFAKITVNKNFAAPPPQVCANRKEMLQITLNLLMNAAQAMPGGGEITIATALDQSRARLSIADRGPGVPDPIKDKIMNPFFTTKPVGLGTGLGLSISYRIVEKNGGALSFRNRPGGGAEFTVSLPSLNNSQTNC